jgi:hypothetical protein
MEQLRAHRSSMFLWRKVQFVFRFFPQLSARTPIKRF